MSKLQAFSRAASGSIVSNNPNNQNNMKEHPEYGQIERDLRRLINLALTPNQLYSIDDSESEDEAATCLRVAEDIQKARVYCEYALCSFMIPALFDDSHKSEEVMQYCIEKTRRMLVLGITSTVKRSTIARYCARAFQGVCSPKHALCVLLVARDPETLRNDVRSLICKALSDEKLAFIANQIETFLRLNKDVEWREAELQLVRITRSVLVHTVPEVPYRDTRIVARITEAILDFDELSEEVIDALYESVPLPKTEFLYKCAIENRLFRLLCTID